MLPHFRKPCLYCLKTLLRVLKISSWHFPALLLEAMQHVNHIMNSRQVHHAVPTSSILIPQFKNARANGRQRTVIARPLALLQLPQLKSQVLSHVRRETQQDLPGVALPGHHSVFGPFAWFAHSREYTSKSLLRIIHLTVYLRPWVPVAQALLPVRLSPSAPAHDPSRFDGRTSNGVVFLVVYFQ